MKRSAGSPFTASAAFKLWNARFPSFARNETLNVAVQNLVEFWAVATRHEGNENGLGMTIETAMKELAALKELFPVLPEPSGLFEEWERLVTTYRVAGKNTHDAHEAIHPASVR